jgi:hypothetical protein
MTGLVEGFRWYYAQLDEQQQRKIRDQIRRERLPHHETPADRRAAELGPLGAFLRHETPEPGLAYPVPNRIDYDEARPEGALASRTLVRRYGSWNAACASAYLVADDGTYDRPSRHWKGNQPWPHWNLHIRGRPRYSRDDAVAAIRMCGEALDRIPNAATYHYWAGVKRIEGRRRGIDVRLPTPLVFTRLFPNGGFYAARQLAFPDTDEKGTS